SLQPAERTKMNARFCQRLRPCIIRRRIARGFYAECQYQPKISICCRCPITMRHLTEHGRSLSLCRRDNIIQEFNPPHIASDGALEIAITRAIRQGSAPMHRFNEEGADSDRVSQEALLGSGDYSVDGLANQHAAARINQRKLPHDKPTPVCMHVN